ncbi:hypothetical protein BDD12DRAFT_833312 [Trichophaea hybrida]|nr:hypothetical protein BDD12DRAFT_833312 [Trichophaea hybrida]
MEKPKERSKKNKKPYHFKKSDLDLDEYKKEIRDQSPGYLVERAIIVLKTSRQLHLYVILQVLAACLGFGQIMMSIGILWMFYVNTSTRARKSGEKSAYSIFNENVEAIEGATQMEYLERELRRQLY